MNLQLNEAFDILGINSNSTIDEIHNAYRRAVKENHPDQVGGNEDKIKAVIAAYEMVNKYINTKNKKQLDVMEIRKTQAAARARAQAKMHEQQRREKERQRAMEEERIRKIKKIYNDLMQSREFKKQSISEDYFIEHIDDKTCNKWVTIHLYAINIYTRREKYIKEYASWIDSKNKDIDVMIPFTKLNPNPINSGKKQSYRAMINKQYGTIGEAIDTVYKTFILDIADFSKCLDFTEDSYISYLIGDEAYRNRIYKIVENKLASYYKIAKYIASKPECAKDINEGEFLNVRSDKYTTDITRMKNIESYVNRVYIFGNDGSISINNSNITRTEYQQARDWLNVVRNNNSSKVDRLTILIYINYVAGCLEFIYDRIPHPEFNPNVSPAKLLEIAKVINTLEKYYVLSLEDGISDCFNAYLKVKDRNEYKGKKLSTILEELLELNKMRKIINKYYLHSYYSLEEIVLMSKEKLDLLYNKALKFKEEIEEYLVSRKDNAELVDLYLRKLKDNKKFAPLFSDDVTLEEIMRFLEMKKIELTAISAPDKPSLEKFIFMSDKEIAVLREAPKYEEMREFIKGHNENYSSKNYQAIQHSNVNIELVGNDKELDKMSRKQIAQVYRDTVIGFLNENHPKYRDNNLNNASFGRLSSDVVNGLIKDAEDEVVIKSILKIVRDNSLDISEEDIRKASYESRVNLLKKLSSEEGKGVQVSTSMKR